MVYKRWTNKSLLIALLFSILFINPSYAFMPPSHYFFNTEYRKLNIDSNLYLYRDFIADPELAYAGNILVDFSLIYGYYTTEGGLKYAALHDGAFCEAMLQQSNDPISKGCAIGSCTHLFEDVQSHTKMVVSSIEYTGLPNSIIHTFSEQHFDNILQSKSPELKNRALNVSRFYECKPIYKKVLLGMDLYKDDVASGVFDRNFDKFIDEISGSVTSYDLGFRKLGSTFDNLKAIPLGIMAVYIMFTLLFVLSFFLLIFRKNKTWINWVTMILLVPMIFILVWLFIANLQGNAFVTFIKIISLISNIVPIGDPDAHINIVLTNARNFFTQGETAIINVHASGFREMGEADSKVAVLDYIILAILFSGIALLFWVNIRRKKDKSIGIRL